MENDTKLLQELVLNERKVVHEKYGPFLIKRPTQRILADIDTARTRQINRDLQARESVLDNATGELKHVPAFLSRNSKAEQLKFHGLWSDSNEEDIIKATDIYRQACLSLELAGYTGIKELEDAQQALRTKMLEILGPAGGKLIEQINTVLPSMALIENGSVKDDDKTRKAYSSAKDKLKKKAASPLMDQLLRDADDFHKQACLLYEGISSQAILVTLRIREYALFSDTLESRADRATQVAKTFYCSWKEDGKKRAFVSTSELEDSDPEIITWLFGQIEKLERLEPGETEKDLNNKDRFNFLAPRQVSSLISENLPDPEQSKPDGDSAVE